MRHTNFGGVGSEYSIYKIINYIVACGGGCVGE